MSRYSLLTFLILLGTLQTVLSGDDDAFNPFGPQLSKKSGLEKMEAINGKELKYESNEVPADERIIEKRRLYYNEGEANPPPTADRYPQNNEYSERSRTNFTEPESEPQTPEFQQRFNNWENEKSRFSLLGQGENFRNPEEMRSRQPVVGNQNPEEMGSRQPFVGNQNPEEMRSRQPFVGNQNPEEMRSRQPFVGNQNPEEMRSRQLFVGSQNPEEMRSRQLFVGSQNPAGAQRYDWEMRENLGKERPIWNEENKFKTFENMAQNQNIGNNYNGRTQGMMNNNDMNSYSEDRNQNLFNSRVSITTLNDQEMGLGKNYNRMGENYREMGRGRNYNERMNDMNSGFVGHTHMSYYNKNPTGIWSSNFNTPEKGVIINFNTECPKSRSFADSQLVHKFIFTPKTSSESFPEDELISSPKMTPMYYI